MTPWDQFFRENITKIFEEKKEILDIGGGLRIDREKNNRYNPSREWIRPYLEKVNYKILDPVPDYHPDIVGDIHDLPLPDASTDAIICIAVLEHIENPFKAFEQMYRVLRPGGYCFIYVPFLYIYHAMPGYYGDYWRYTPDSLLHLSKQFSSQKIQHVRGPFETLLYMALFGKVAFLTTLARWADARFKKASKQTSGYHLMLVK